MCRRLHDHDAFLLTIVKYLPIWQPFCETDLRLKQFVQEAQFVAAWTLKMPAI
jgi:hypothetical protein